jgi:hypothetical protein
MVTFLTFLLIANANVFFFAAWIITDFDTAYDKFEAIAKLIWE